MSAGTTWFPCVNGSVSSKFLTASLTEGEVTANLDLDHVLDTIPNKQVLIPTRPNLHHTHVPCAVPTVGVKSGRRLLFISKVTDEEIGSLE